MLCLFPVSVIIQRFSSLSSLKCVLFTKLHPVRTLHCGAQLWLHNSGGGESTSLVASRCCLHSTVGHRWRSSGVGAEKRCRIGNPKPSRTAFYAATEARHANRQRNADNLLETSLTRPELWVADTWDRNLAVYRELYPHATSAIVDFRYLHVCQQHRTLAPARALMRHRDAWSGGDVAPATLSKYLSVCGECCDQATDADVLDTYALLSGTLDLNSEARIINALCQTGRWRLALERLEAGWAMLGDTSVVGTTAAKAFDADDAAVGWRLLYRMLDGWMRPDDGPLYAWLRSCQRRAVVESRAELTSRTKAGSLVNSVDSAHAMLLQLFSYLQKSNAPVSADVAAAIVEFSTGLLVDKWRGQTTFVTNSGLCEHCGATLPESLLTDSEFAELRDRFVSSILIGKDVFITSTPAEVERFREFVAKTAPYDVVVDGLNVSYAIPKHHLRQGHPLGTSLTNLVRHFVERGKRVLVVGRFHMRGWNKNRMDYVKRNALIFTADNMSEDDAFMLYAVLHSHQRTQFVTRDLLRNYACRFSNPQRDSFSRLVRRNRIQVTSPSNEHRNIRLSMPYLHDVRTQTDGHGGWHIPYSYDELPQSQSVNIFSTVTPSAAQPVTDRWLCLRAPNVR